MAAFGRRRVCRGEGVGVGVCSSIRGGPQSWLCSSVLCCSGGKGLGYHPYAAHHKAALCCVCRLPESKCGPEAGRRVLPLAACCWLRAASCCEG